MADTHLIVVDVGWYRLIVDPEKVFYNMNIRDFKKMLRVATSVLDCGVSDHPFIEKINYLSQWENFLNARTDLNTTRRKRMLELVVDRRIKIT